MPGQGVPDPGRQGDSSKRHSDAVEAAQQVLSELHQPGSFDLKVVTAGNVTLAVATDNQQYFAERHRVGEDFRTIDAVLKLGEKRPEPGSVHSITVGNGQVGQIKFDSMQSLLKLAQLGIDTALTAYVLIEEERRTIQSFVERIEALKRG